MRQNPLNSFIEQIMKVEAGYAGMGGASTGILGMSGTNGQIVLNLRRDAIAFATEYVQHNQNKAQLNTLAQQLEGSLQTVKLVDGISDDKLKLFVDELHDLVSNSEKN